MKLNRLFFICFASVVFIAACGGEKDSQSNLTYLDNLNPATNKVIIEESVAIYQENGLYGLKNHVESCYGDSLKNKDRCIIADFVGYTLDFSVSMHMGFPEDDFFNFNGLQSRLSKVESLSFLNNPQLNEFIISSRGNMITALVELKNKGN